MSSRSMATRLLAHGDEFLVETAFPTNAAVAHWQTSIALDAAGNPHISYEDRSTADLEYAAGVLTPFVPMPGMERIALTVAPNPAGATGVLVEYRVPEGGVDATLAVFDASGVYFLRLTSGGRRAGRARVNRRGATPRRRAPLRAPARARRRRPAASDPT